MENKKAEDIRKKAEAEAGKMLKQAEEKGRLIIEEAKKNADSEVNKTLKDVEQKGRLIIEEAKKKADSEASRTLKDAEQRGRLIIEEAKKKARPESKAVKPGPDSEQKARQIIEEARKKAEADAGKIVTQAEQKARQITEEARKRAEAEVKPGKPAPEAEHKGLQIIEEARKKAEAEASRIVKDAEQKARQIIEESKKKVDDETRASKIITEAEQKARQLIEQAERIAAAPAAERPRHLIRLVREKAAGETKPEEEALKVSPQKRVELVIIPPVDFAQLERLRLSLQQLSDLRVLSMGGSPGGGTQISIQMGKPAPLVHSLRGMEVVEEAIDEEQLDSHPLGDFLKKAIPARPSKRPPEEQRILVVLKRPH